MSARFNETNNGGLVTVAGGQMPTDNFTDSYGQEVAASHAQPGGVTVLNSPITVTSNGNAVERGGDLGLWDTVANKGVSPDKCTFGPNVSNYPNV